MSKILYSKTRELAEILGKWRNRLPLTQHNENLIFDKGVIIRSMNALYCIDDRGHSLALLSLLFRTGGYYASPAE